MSHSGETTLRARYVFPGTSPPLADGTVTFAAGRILSIGGTRTGSVDDLGNVAILPGLVNAHTHLEFSDLAAPLGQPGMSLVEWIRAVIAYRRAIPTALGKGTVPFSSNENWDSPRSPIEMGLRESLRLGTTMIGDISQPGSGAQSYAASPCTGTRFLELIAPTGDRIPVAMENVRRHLAAADEASPWQAGLSPHAPYSVHPDLLRQAVELSADRHVPLAMHLAESREEIELLRDGGGPFEPLLRSLGAWNPPVAVRNRRPLDYLRMLSQAHHALVIHGNYLDDEEIAFLAANRVRMAVVYCPRTHAWFDHRPYPLEKFLAAGALVALGTDSRASTPDLSLLAEMRAVARKHPTVSLATVLALGTLNGARALGRAGESGSLEAGKWADLTVVALPDRAADDPHELLLHAGGAVVRTVCRGKWC